mmetsp:Transcript_19672/g.41282  ORF Transcript_19672/g.41282 Transcript_19672/m.41282 type:complete len:211 (-) Transcript_19672:170-802(-)
MDDVSVDFGVDDGAAKVVGSTDIVVDGVALGFGVFHGVGSGALFCEMDDGVWFFFLDELDEEVVLLGNVEVNEFDVLSGDFLPCLDTDLGTLNGSERIATQLHVDIPPAQIIHDDDIVSLIAEVQRRRPAAEAVPSEDDDLLLLDRAVDADVVHVGSVFEGVELEEGADFIARRGARRRGCGGSDEAGAAGWGEGVGEDGKGEDEEESHG